MSTIVVQSVSTTSWVNNTDIVLTKPTGTVDGDLLVAILCTEEGATRSDDGGFSIETAETADTDTPDIFVLSQIASSEPASWTITFTGTVWVSGIVLRIDGQKSTITAGNALDQSLSAISVNDSTPVWSNQITPTAGASLFFLVVGGHDTGTGASVSSYAITTDNPSWTERADMFDDTDDFLLGVATAFRLESSATGDSSATVVNGDVTTNTRGLIFNILPEPDVTVSPSVITNTTSVQAPAVTGTAVVSPAVVENTASVQDPTVSTEAAKWTNKDKTDTSPTITNKDKS